MPKPASLLDTCRQNMPDLAFTPGGSFYWSPLTKTIFFDPVAISTANGRMALLHEVGHAVLEHMHYTFDAELLEFEVAAWHQARLQAKQWSVEIDLEHIEDCLDTYRDWLYARSTCPVCKVNAPQVSRSRYKCINCSTSWSVSPSRFCRPYRMQSRSQKTPSDQSRTVFS